MKTLTLTSPGITGPAWIKRLEKNKYKVSSYAKELLNNKDFSPSKKGTTYNIVILTASDIGKDSFTTQEMRDEAKKRGLVTPPAEVACTLREQMTDKEIEALGLWYVIVAHEPISDSDGFPDLLRVNRDDGGRWLRAFWDCPDGQWYRVGGWLFLAPQGAQTPGAQTLSDSLNLESRLKVVEEKLEAIGKILLTK